MAAALLVATIFLLGTACPASAHASLVEVTPAEGSVLARQPDAVRIRFNEPVQITAGAASIIGPDGKALDGLSPRPDPRNGTTMVVELPTGLPVGTYAVVWRVVSLDTHPIRGQFDFAIGHPSSPLVQASSTASQGPNLLGGSGRALAVAGALALAGLSAFPLLVLVPARRHLAVHGARLGRSLSDETCRRLRVPLLVSAAVTLLGTSAILFDTALSTGSPVLDTALGTRAGDILLLRLALLVVTVGALAVRPSGTPSTTRLVVGLSGALATLLTFSLSSHAAAAAFDRPVALTFDFAHLVTAGAWIGGLLGLALAGLPAARTVTGRNHHMVGESAAALFSSFSVMAQLAMLGVLITGTYAVLLQVSAPSDLGQTQWGLELVAKLALWASVLLFAATSAFTFVPALAGRAGDTARRLVALDQLRSAMRVEIGVAAGLIVVAAVMSVSPQPAQEELAADQQAALSNVETTFAKGTARGYVARVRTSRTGAGDSASTTLGVALTTGRSPTNTSKAESRLTNDSGVDIKVPLQSQRVGTWSSGLLPIRPGRYHLTTRFDKATQPITIPLDINVPAPPSDVIAAAAGRTGQGPRDRAMTSLAVTLALTALFAVLGGLGLGLRRTRWGQAHVRRQTETSPHAVSATAPVRTPPRSKRPRSRRPSPRSGGGPAAY